MSALVIPGWSLNIYYSKYWVIWSLHQSIPLASSLWHHSVPNPGVPGFYALSLFQTVVFFLFSLLVLYVILICVDVDFVPFDINSASIYLVTLSFLYVSLHSLFILNLSDYIVLVVKINHYMILLWNFCFFFTLSKKDLFFLLYY